MGITDFISSHAGLISGAAVMHAAHLAWNFWQDNGGVNGLKLFIMTGSSTPKEIPVIKDSLTTQPPEAKP